MEKAFATTLTLAMCVLLTASAATAAHRPSWIVEVPVSDSSGKLVTTATVTLGSSSTLTGVPGFAFFNLTSPGQFALSVSAPGYQTYTSNVTVGNSFTWVPVTLRIVAAQTFTSQGASASASAGFKGASISFTNQAVSTETANVYFVWYNSANQVVSVGAQLNVAFSAGQSLTFFNAYNIHGIYTVKVLVQAPDGSALSSAYSASVSV